MSNKCMREERYIVFKLADVEKDFFPSEISQLLRLFETKQNMRKQGGKPPLECVVVEKDWPEYEPTWKAIEARVTGAQPAPSVPREAIDKTLTQLMDIAVSNGANSVSMPDEYVEVAAWLCGIPTQRAQGVPDGVAEALQRLIENGAVLGPGSAEDALLVARYRQHLLACAPSAPDGWKLVPNVPEGFSREDLEAVADGLDGYEKTVNVGNVTGEGDGHLESTTAYAARFIRAMLAATEAKP